MKRKTVGFTAGRTNRMKAKLVFVVAGTPFLLASPAVYALNGGHTVTVTNDGPLLTQDKADKSGSFQFIQFSATLSKGTHPVPTDKECGEKISWSWDMPSAAFSEDSENVNGQPVPYDVDPSQIATLTGDGGDEERGPSAVLQLPIAAKARHGRRWAATVRATASQSPNTCYPQGWTQNGTAVGAYHDVQVTTPPPPDPGVIPTSIPS